MSFSSSRNALLIQLERVQLEDIIEKKLLYFLEQKSLKQRALRIFYEPVEQAIIELFLKKQGGNQFKTAKALGINRNTLKKKILNYKVNIQEILVKENKLMCFQSRIFVGSVSHLDLLSVCRIKLFLDDSRKLLPAFDVLHKVCRPVEGRIIQKVLEACKGNQIRASQFLGINRNTLRKKMDFISKVKAS
ncbi:MAG: hypothetical protein OXN83_00820 [Oligoflexia bacterium]|nr:hypothetical protein [Oligoflexia bacterium]